MKIFFVTIIFFLFGLIVSWLGIVMFMPNIGIEKALLIILIIAIVMAIISIRLISKKKLKT